MTDPVSTGSWKRTLAVLEHVLDVPAADRERAIDDACAGDDELAQRVRRWLASSDAVAPMGEWTAFNREALAELDAPLEPGVRVGAWQVQRVAGTGGMGTVYEAVRADGAFEQRVALKVIRHAGDPALLARGLEGERSILARLDHPGIARIIDGGLTGSGLPWYAMEFVEGQPIDAWCDSRGLATRERLKLFAQVCDAVGYAHRNLVVHRDLKPSNILVKEQGLPKLLDFGIATMLETAAAPRAPRYPTTLNRVLTPEYASPEQLRGEPATVSADVYSLGVVLHELLTGARPGSVVKTSIALPRDLGAIVNSALAPEARDRYGSVDALADDVRSYLTGLPVRARADTWTYRSARFLGRHRVASALIAVALLALALTTAFALRQAARAERSALAASQSSAFVTGLLELTYPFDSGGGASTLHAIMDSGSARAHDLQQSGLAVSPELLEALATGYYGLGRFDRAIVLDSQALVRRISAGEHDSMIVGTRWALAEALRLGGRQREAVAVFREIEPEIARLDGAESVTMGRLLQSLARGYRSLGEIDSAHRLLDRAQAIFERNPGQARISLAHAHQTRGHLYLERDSLDQAESEYRIALDVRRRVGANQLEIANSVADLATVARRRGQFALADSLLDQSLRVKRAQLGDRHPEVGDDLRERAAIALARGDTLSAVRFIREALARYSAHGSVPQWRHAPALVLLATAMGGEGRAAEADSLLDLALDQLRALETSPSKLQLEAERLHAMVNSHSPPRARP